MPFAYISHLSADSQKLMISRLLHRIAALESRTCEQMPTFIKGTMLNVLIPVINFIFFVIAHNPLNHFVLGLVGRVTALKF